MKTLVIAAATITVLSLSAGTDPASAQTCEPIQICGDVDDSGALVATDAQKVLRKAVGQNVALVCECGQTGAVCGDDVIEGSEDCETGKLGGETCVTLGLAGGTLGCQAGCTFDTSACYEERFDTAGPTIIDLKTGLEWEKKDAADSIQDLANPHDVDNRYTWAAAGSTPDGTVFTDFLVQLNSPTGSGSVSVGGETTTGCYANHCDWRLPTIQELQTYLQGVFPNCGFTPCSFPAFNPVATINNWSVSTSTDTMTFTWTTRENDGGSNTVAKIQLRAARAVRGGS